MVAIYRPRTDEVEHPLLVGSFLILLPVLQHIHEDCQVCIDVNMHIFKNVVVGHCADEVQDIFTVDLVIVSCVYTDDVAYGMIVVLMHIVLAYKSCASKNGQAHLGLLNRTGRGEFAGAYSPDKLYASCIIR